MIKEALKNKISNTVAKKLLTHTTTEANLRKILQSGKLMPLKQLATERPNDLVNVEKAITSLLDRKTMPASEAAKAMKGVKEIDKLFLAEGGYLPAYGDYIVARKAYAPAKRKALNMIPNEYATDKAVNILDNDTTIFVPDNLIQYWKKEFPNINFRPKSEFSGKEYTRLHGLADLPNKTMGIVSDEMSNTTVLRLLKDLGLLSPQAAYGAVGGIVAGTAVDDNYSLKDGITAAMLGAALGAGHKNLRGIGGFFGNKKLNPELLANADDAYIKRIFGDQAILAGSKPLGINIGTSDTDILSPYKTDFFYNRAIKDMIANPEFTPSKLNAVRPDKQVFTYKNNGKDIDVVLARGDKGFAFRDAFLNASKNLTDEQRAEIIAQKKALQDAWILKNLRYKRYKNQIADELGLKEHYF